MSDQGSNNQPPQQPGGWPQQPPPSWGAPPQGPPPQGPPPSWGGPPQGPPPQGPNWGGPPGGGYGGGGGVQTTLWLVLSIVMTVFCCLPLGVGGIVFSAMAGSKNNVGDYQGAAANIRVAKILLLIGVILGVLIAAGWILVAVIGASSGDSSN